MTHHNYEQVQEKFSKEEKKKRRSDPFTRFVEPMYGKKKKNSPKGTAIGRIKRKFQLT